MNKLTHAIVKTPCKAMVDGLTTAPELGKPDYELALKQHEAYIAALKKCGLEVTVLPADEEFPDSCFVEDPAILAYTFAVITNPAADSRYNEKHAILEAVKEFYKPEQIETIKDPGTLEGDDVLFIGNHLFVGRSARTNKEGIKQLKAVLDKYGYDFTEVIVEKVLQLKAGVGYIGGNHVLVSGEFVGHPAFKEFNVIEVADDEAYAANCIQVNGTVIAPAGYPKTLAAIEALGYDVITVDISEFRKLDGGISSLSLRF